MSARILAFPQSRHLASVRREAATTMVLPFPSATHVKLLASVVAAMSECSSFEAAKAHLIWHLDIWWDRLDDLGACNAEADCRAFAVAALERYFSDAEQGAA